MPKESTEIVKSPEVITPMSMLAIAVQQNADLDKIAKLMDLQERWEKREAEKAFVAALAAFKKAPPEIAKNRKVSYETSKGKTEYKHSTLDRVTTGIGSALAAHGLSARWKTAQVNGKISVSCILQHELGHAESTILEASPDDTGSKNSVQAIGSTITYLERYTLLAATGMATADDSDGITFGDAEDMVNSLKSATTQDELQERFNKVYKRAFAAKDKAAMAIAIETKDARKKELSGIPPANIPPESAESLAQKKAIEDFHAKWEARGQNKAQRHMMLGKHDGNLAAADKEFESLAPPAGSAQNVAETPKKGKAAKAGKPSEPAPPTPKSESTEQERLGF